MYVSLHIYVDENINRSRNLNLNYEIIKKVNIYENLFKTFTYEKIDIVFIKEYVI